MTNTAAQIASELERLLDNSVRMLMEFGKKNEQPFRQDYQSWYTRSLRVVQQLLPERVAEFTTLYEDERRKSITAATYSIADYLRGLIPHGYDQQQRVAHRFEQQYRILESARTRLNDVLSNIQGLLQVDLLDSELDAADELLKAGHLRAAGTLAGVVLERHLAKVCSSRGITSRKVKSTLADWNDMLKDAGVYDLPPWRGIQRLTDIRNLCAQAKDRDPTKDEVDELIRGAERITKTVL